MTSTTGPLPVLLAVVLIFIIVLLAAAASSFRVAGMTAAQWGDRYHVLVLGLVMTLGIATFLAYWWPRRHQARSFTLVGGIALAMATFGLGLPAYWNCHGNQAAVWSPLYNTLALFTGTVADRTGARLICSAPMPLALQIARLSAILTTLLSVLAALNTLFADQVDRLRVRFARHLVLVTGLGPDTLALIEALVAKEQSATVVIIEPNLAHPAVVEARRLGARVIMADPSSQAALKSVVHKRALVRSVYLLGTSPDVNVAICGTLIDLERFAAQTLTGIEVAIIVRIDDPWQAEDWRRAQIGRSGDYLVDTIGLNQTTAQELLDTVLEAGGDRAIILGSGLLALAVLDELAQHRREQSTTKEPCPLDVRVVDEGAVELLADHELHQGWFGNNTRQQLAYSPTTPTVQVLEVQSQGASRVWVIDTRPAGAQQLLSAQRIAARIPTVTMLVPQPGLQGVGTTPMLTNMFPYGFTLTARGPRDREDNARIVPEDAWTRLTRRLHETYLDRHPDATGAGTRTWNHLDDFYRFSNLRSIRLAMTVTSSAGRTWLAPTNTDSSGAPAPLTEDELQQLAHHEHASWLQYYRAGGWRYGRTKNAQAKLNPYLLEWDELDSEGRARAGDQIRDALVNLEALGYRPYAYVDAVRRRDGAAVFLRGGVIRAAPQDQSFTWTNEKGGTMEAQAGDWRVTAPDGSEWSVSDIDFRRTYEHVGNDEWRRTGLVTAVQATKPELRETREGRILATPGDWLVEDESGAQWVVPADGFTSRYLPASGGTHDPVTAC